MCDRRICCERNCCCRCYRRDRYLTEEDEVLMKIGVSIHLDGEKVIKKIMKSPEAAALFRLCKDYEKEIRCYR